MAKLERVNATDLVVNTIREKIQKGELKIGDRLPKEADLADEMGVGRSSLREGLKILNAYGVVESRQGEGTFIVDNIASNFFDFLGFRSTEENMRHFLELRRVLEVGNITDVCRKIDDDGIKTLESMLSQFEMDNLSRSEYCEIDKQFHTFLIAYTNNPMLIQVNNMITAMRSELLEKLFQHDVIIETARSAHRKIVQALKAHDEDACIDAVSEHLDTTVAFIPDVY